VTKLILLTEMCF